MCADFVCVRVLFCYLFCVVWAVNIILILSICVNIILILSYYFVLKNRTSIQIVIFANDLLNMFNYIHFSLIDQQQTPDHWQILTKYEYVCACLLYSPKY